MTFAILLYAKYQFFNLFGCLNTSNFLVLNLILFPLVASQTVSFADFSSRSSDLVSLQGQRIQIRGFWYPLSDNEGILSSQPNLKSCCYQSSALLNHQIIVNGHLSSIPAQRAVTLEGIFRIKLKYNSEGVMQQQYLLEEAQEYKSTNHSILPYFIISIFFLGICMCFKRFNKKERLN